MTADIDRAPATTRATFSLDAFGRALRRYAIFIILAALIVFFDFAEPAFLRVNNLFSVLQSVAVVALLGIGVTVTLAVDGFDLSVGSIAAFTLMLSSYAMVVLQFSAAATVALALATGAAIGLVNGLLIVGLRIPDLLATLGMMFLLAGLQLIPSAGRSITTGLILPDGSVAQGSLRPRLPGDRPAPVVGRRAAAGRDRRGARARLLVLHGAHTLGSRLLRGRRQRNRGLSRRRAGARPTASPPM